MTAEARRRNLEAAQNVIALATAYHHRHDDAMCELVAQMSESEMAQTLLNAAQCVAELWRVDAREMGMEFDGYVQSIAAAVVRRGEA